MYGYLECDSTVLPKMTNMLQPKPTRWFHLDYLFEILNIYINHLASFLLQIFQTSKIISRVHPHEIMELNWKSANLTFVHHHLEKKTRRNPLTTFKSELMLTHFANNEPFLLLNKKYASYEICCRIVITQFHNFTNNFNARPQNHWQPICKHSCHIPIMAVMVWYIG